MISAVITAAGNSSRFGENKMLLDLAGKPLIVRTIEQFDKCDRIDEIIVTARQHEIVPFQELFNSHNLDVKVVEGGAERIQSIYNGVKASRGSIVITHDGARPLTPVWLIENLIDAVEEYGAAMTAVPPTATIKHADEHMIIQRSFERKSTWIAQTPQGFKRDIVLSAMETAIEQNYFPHTDDSEIIALYGHKVKIVMGDYINIKVTVKSDFSLANELFRTAESEASIV